MRVRPPPRRPRLIITTIALAFIVPAPVVQADSQDESATGSGWSITVLGADGHPLGSVTVSTAKPSAPSPGQRQNTLRPLTSKDTEQQGNRAARKLNMPHPLQGIASYYWQDQMTASGTKFDKDAMTAAHPTLPFGTRVQVTRLDTGRSVVVTINDRGPFKPGRIIDLSKKAAEKLEFTLLGLTQVRLQIMPPS